MPVNASKRALIILVIPTDHSGAQYRGYEKMDGHPENTPSAWVAHAAAWPSAPLSPELVLRRAQAQAEPERLFAHADQLRFRALHAQRPTRSAPMRATGPASCASVGSTALNRCPPPPWPRQASTGNTGLEFPDETTVQPSQRMICSKSVPNCVCASDF
jgi:hypothetical protein